MFFLYSSISLFILIIHLSPGFHSLHSHWDHCLLFGNYCYFEENVSLLSNNSYIYALRFAHIVSRTVWDCIFSHLRNGHSSVHRYFHLTGPSSQKNAEMRKFAAKSITVDGHSLIKMQHYYSKIHQENSNIQRGIKEQYTVTWGTVLVDNNYRDRMTAGGLTAWMVRNNTRIIWKEKWRSKCKWNKTK
jgi:hypothetical protein